VLAEVVADEFAGVPLVLTNKPIDLPGISGGYADLPDPSAMELRGDRSYWVRATRNGDGTYTTSVSWDGGKTWGPNPNDDIRWVLT